MNTKKKTYLKDYKPFSHIINTVSLTFCLSPNSTRVKSLICFSPRPNCYSENIFLHGEDLTLISFLVDGKKTHPHLSENGLTCKVPNSQFTIECEVEISPRDNTALEGLYMSNDMYCTQCEAEGFRKITYYPDRPDVLSKFFVRIEDPYKSVNTLLSNGNLIGKGDGWAEWHDPWPKPSYLFALVAGNLVNYPDTFITKSGREVALNIWVRPGDEEKCSFAMTSLISSMAWDERVYGREYDLEIFNIVAVEDFNMGAMENKGLNIFNSSCCLANPKTTTDKDFERIETIIAHEYFHNWTGNRITCRDWFQLCLKEGLTVFRDFEFSSTIRSPSVRRIEDVMTLRSIQFSEDGGPLAHPVRPESFVEINNFYTSTVYEKGAELIGMIKTLVGDNQYYEALNLYFKRHDGDAATIENWLKVFEDTSGRNLSQFKTWYQQSGTPHLFVDESFENGIFQLICQQITYPTPDQSKKKPLLIPIAVGLLDENGKEIISTRVLEMTKERQTFKFKGLESRPIASILRNFSAPVYLHHHLTEKQQEFLLINDTDLFNRWQSAHTMIKSSLVQLTTGEKMSNKSLFEALGQVLSDELLDPAFRALLIQLPTSREIATSIREQGQIPDPADIFKSREHFKYLFANSQQEVLSKIFNSFNIAVEFSPNASQCAARSLSNQALTYLSALDKGVEAQKLFYSSNNMTQKLFSLYTLLSLQKGEEELTKFYKDWKLDRLVVDKWFSVQILACNPEKLAKTAKKLTSHKDFSFKNPNRFKSIFGKISENFSGFHHKSGDSYEIFTDWLIKMDKINPQVAARLCTAFQDNKFDEHRKLLITSNLKRLQNEVRLSVDTTEIVNKLLAS